MRLISCLFLMLSFCFATPVEAQEDESFKFNKENIKEPKSDSKEKEKAHIVEGFKRPAKNVLKISPMALLFGQIPLTGELRVMYEMATAPRQSSFIGASLNY